MSHSISIDTTQHQIHSVCVFRSDHAEIRRNIQVDLHAGQNEVKIEKLPNCMDKDSIRVEGIGNAVIFDVIHSPPPPVDSAKDRAEERAALKAVERKRAELEAELKICEDQAHFLKDYGKTLNAEKTDISKLDAFLDLYMQKKRAIHTQNADISDKLAIVREDVTQKQQALWVDAEGQRRAVTVTVIVLADSEGPAELSLSYMVSGASWTPLYDLRAVVPSSPNVQSSVALQYRASISQDTGENWNDVDLTLSTASPMTSTHIPELPSYRIGAPPPPPVLVHAPAMIRTGSAFQPSIIRIGSPEFHPTSPRYSPASPGYSPTSPQGMFVPAPPPKIVYRAVGTAENAISTTFAIEGKSTIPSDSKGDAQTHKVSIALLDLPATLEWITLPRKQAVAFLRSQIRNTSDNVLLPGPASVFMNDNFVCKSSIPHVSPQETFSTSLGVDPSIKVTYHTVQKKLTINTGSLIGTKTDITSLTQRITLKNNRRTAVVPLYVKDHIPVSEESAFKVTLHEPKDLGQAKEKREVRVAPGVTARWAFKGDPEVEGVGHERGSSTTTSRGVEEDGTVEWICDMDPGKTLEITLSYHISAPVGQSWVQL